MVETMTMGDRVTGKLREDGVYISYRTEKHFFRKYNGFGITTSLLMDLRRQGCKQVIIVYQQGSDQILFKAHPDAILEHGQIYHYKGMDWQRILPLEYWQQESSVEFIQPAAPYHYSKDYLKSRSVNFQKLKGIKMLDNFEE